MKPVTQVMPSARERSITLLGATGSIGKSTLRLLEQHSDRFGITALTAYDNTEELAALAKKFVPRLAVIGKENEYTRLKDMLDGTGIRVAAGSAALEEAAALPSDIVMAAIVGAAGLKPTLAAIKRGATVALANKECLVCAGELVIRDVAHHGATLIPVDSEHNALFQLFDYDHPETIESITLTASGGPFREYSLRQMQDITPEQAVLHPNWSMGRKISVDSATMMNKALEIIEAYHLFPVEAEQIKVVVHPESIIHGMVSYIDGSTLAQMGTPDMTTPIASAIAWPERISNNVPEALNFAELGKLTFEAPDTERFPALRLAYEALEAGGIAPAVLNAANEVAVAEFLEGRIQFLDIARVVEHSINAMDNSHSSSLTIEEIIEIDSEARSVAKDHATEKR